MRAGLVFSSFLVVSTAVVAQPPPIPPEIKVLERWVGELKRALGVGGAVEGDALVLQGDVRDRVSALLAARGVKKVTRG